MNQPNIIVIGASAGGVQALIRVVQGLPEIIPASIFIVVHTSPSGVAVLDQILNRVDGNRALYATDGMKIKPNAIYIAPPDRHMLLVEDEVKIVMGPQINRSRPSVDVLFRSAATAYGKRVIGVILTGYLGDGSAGLAMIKECGGTTVIQDPKDAEASGMPEQALLRTVPDYCLPLNEIPSVLAGLVLEPKPARGAMSKNRKSRITQSLKTHSTKSSKDLTGFTCPDCHGAIWEVKETDGIQFECRVGHAYSPQSMMDAHGDSVERAVWTALKSLEENIALMRRLMKYSRDRNRQKATGLYEQQILEKEKHALVLHILLNGSSDQLLHNFKGAERYTAEQKMKAEEAA